MKHPFLLVVLTFCVFTKYAFSQETKTPEKYTAHNKGKFYIFWGGNRESYTKSDIHFTGQNYDFELNEVFFQDLKIKKANNFLNADGEDAA